MIPDRNENDLVGHDGRILWVKRRLPERLPPGWRVLNVKRDGAAYLSGDGLSVVVSGAREGDGKRWLHVSCSRRERLPSWDDLRLVKDVLVGDDYAVQILPPRRFYVNTHPFCLHLFSCLDGHPLPEFSAWMPGLGRTL